MATELKINGVLRPINSTDETHEDIYGKGGFVTVASTVARNDIPMERRKEGMVVNVIADNTWYKLVGGITNLDWSTDIASNISTSGGSVTTNWDVTDAGAGIIPSADSNSKLATIPLLSSAGYRDESYFVTMNQFDGELDKFPTTASIYNIIDTLANLALLPDDDPESIDVGTIVHVLQDNTTYQATSTNPNVWALYDPETDYITATDAGTIYLSKTDAISDYLSKVDAISDYLSKVDAGTTYLSKVDAISDYLSKTDAGTTYLTQVNATSTYLTKVDATNLYPTEVSTIPASSNSDGVKGQYVYDTANGFKYECITTGTGGSGEWVQIIIATSF